MLPPRQRTAALAAALALTLSACGTSADDASDPGATPAPTATTSPEDTTSPSSPSTEEDSVKPSPIPVPDPGDAGLPTGPVPDSIVGRPDVQAAISAEAERTGAAVEDVTVEGWAEVTWSDGSLGCPEPGMMYTQALVPGYQLILGVDGTLASYHAAKDKPFSYCANPVPPAQTSSTS